MNDAALSVAPVLARNCEFGCGFFHFRGYPRCRSPPDFLKFQFSNFKKNGGYIDVLRSRKKRKENTTTQKEPEHEDNSLSIQFKHMDAFKAVLDTIETLRKEVA